MSWMRLRVGPFLLCLCVALYRASWLSVQLSGLDAAQVGFLLLADLPVLGLLGLLAFAELALPKHWKLVPLLLTVVLVAAYLADVLAVLALNARLQLSDIRRFGGEWWLASSFVSASTLIVLLVTAGAFLVAPPAPVMLVRLLPASALVLLLLPLAVAERAIPSHLQKYSGSVLLLGRELWGAPRPPIPRYRPGDVAAYRAEYEALFDAPFARTGRDVILVIVESLSAVDSLRTSGVADRLPRLDTLSREGMLFRNFLANFEASEGGIVALASGVPPLHFPTASTNTFGEYARQRAITDAFRRAGYRCEFLTSVPLQFISMDAYATSPSVGFAAAAGQHQIPRYADAPRFGFESPADRVLYEELLARLDARDAIPRQPLLMVAVTASSHTPYVDPLGRADTAENVWSYVQDELAWLHGQLDRRGFFENGVLLITGDHRRMMPVHEAERERYGDSAKARIPLVVIGAGVPRDVVDDRLLQQADLLRMLDRLATPSADLSPFAVWVERYVFVFGVASNASSLEVFDPADSMRRAHRLRLRGAEIEWLNPPGNALAIERAIHRQRALQQATRSARVAAAVLRFGRDLEPGPGSQGALVGLSTDVDLARDPDDPRGALRRLTADVSDVEHVLRRAGGWTGPLTLTARAFLSVPEDGEYWFSVFADDESCLAIDKEVVLGCQPGLNESAALLTAGPHRFDLRYADRGGSRVLRLRWLPPGATAFTALPADRLIAPQSGPEGSGPDDAR